MSPSPSPLSLSPSLSPSVWYLVNGLVQLRLLQGKTMRRHKAKPETKTEAETNWKSKSKSINACLGGPSPPSPYHYLSRCPCTILFKCGTRVIEQQQGRGSSSSIMPPQREGKASEGKRKEGRELEQKGEGREAVAELCTRALPFDDILA